MKHTSIKRVLHEEIFVEYDAAFVDKRFRIYYLYTLVRNENSFVSTQRGDLPLSLCLNHSDEHITVNIYNVDFAYQYKVCLKVTRM